MWQVVSWYLVIGVVVAGASAYAVVRRRGARTISAGDAILIAAAGVGVTVLWLPLAFVVTHIHRGGGA